MEGVRQFIVQLANSISSQGAKSTEVVDVTTALRMMVRSAATTPNHP